MRRISRSGIHEGNVVTVFRGNRLANGNTGKFLFAEAEALFGKENLATNLIEITASEQLDLSDFGLADFLKRACQDNPNHKLNIIDVSVSGREGYEIDLLFNPKSLKSLAKSSIFEDMHSRGFNVRSLSTTSFGQPLLVNFDTTRMSYLGIQFSESFLRLRSKKLSQNFESSFDPLRYVDSQIPMFLITATLIGMSEISGMCPG